MATIYSISEQVSLKLYGGSPKPNSAVQLPDIKLAVAQKLNELLKVQHFYSMQLGENQPENLMIATYPPITLTTFGSKCKGTLPAVPVGLIRNMGIWEASLSEDFSTLLIPFGAGQADLLRGQSLISDLFGQVGYELYGKQIVLTKDVTIDEQTSLYLRLIISDISTLTDFDVLPIPADMESTVVMQVWQSFASTLSPVKVVDNYAAPQPQMPITK